MRIAFYLASEYKGLILSMSKLLLDEGHDVWLAAWNQDVKSLAIRLVPGLRNRVFVRNDFKSSLRGEDVISEAMHREQVYGETMAMLISHDRGLGQGYLLNADRHPHVHKSLWPNERKLLTVVEDFCFYEDFLDNARPSLVLGHDRPLPLHIAANSRGIPFFTLGVSRIGDRLMWYETPREEKSSLSERIKELAESPIVSKDKDIKYEPYLEYVSTARDLRYSYFEAMRQSVKQIMLEIYTRLRGTHKRDSYVLFGWIPYLFRKKYCYDFVRRHGVAPKDLSRKRVVFFPLHEEPESALLNLSPEFNNSMEIIVWISKSLPADTVLVVKENPWAYGIRSRSFYDRIRKIGNVALAEPSVSSWDWIRAASITVTITGTAGWEAVYFHRQVISFGRYQLINHLPTVRYVTSFFETRTAIQDFLRSPQPEGDLLQSAYALDTAIREKSFSLSGHESVSSSNQLHIDLASTAISQLRGEYPHVLSF